MPKQEILNHGTLACEHNYVYYVDVPFDGQAFWCDEPGCERHEKIPYSPGEKIEFPSRAFIRTSNPDFGGENWYSHRADEDGVVRGILPLKERVSRKALNLESHL